MADPLLVAELRRLTDEVGSATYTDEVLSARLDAADGNVRLVASSIWSEKAASYAGLIDVQEGNSNRKMSQLHANALKMSSAFGVDEVSGSGFRPARTRRIERQ